MKKTQLYSRLGELTTLVTFTIATIICSLYFFTGNLDYGFFGYFFFLFAVPVNLIVLIILLINASKTKNPKRIKRKAGLMLLNIPVAILYFGIGIYFTGVMRITIENNTGSDLRDLKLTGCETEKIKAIKDGEKKTVWIDITGDCYISMSYIDEKGNVQNETIIGYVTSGMGQKFTYEVGKGETGW